MKKMEKILIVDDEKAIRSVLQASLEDEGYEVQTAEDGLTGLSKIKSFRPDVVLLDIWMPGELDGIDVLKRTNDLDVIPQVIIMSGHGTIETAVQATKLGAWDFVEKPLSIDKILILISNIKSYNQQKSEKQNLLAKLRKNLYIVGESKKMIQLKQMISRVAPTMSWVLISGEKGTGKELVAQNIHYLSPRAGRPLVEVNCTALPEELMESELFGYEKDAFAGATEGQLGKFDYAAGGTLLLEEISSLSLDVQNKLVGFLQEKCYQRVGGLEKIQADIRIIATTSVDLTELIREGKFRDDLYHRLNVIPLDIPTLSQRREDIPMLIRHFGNQFAKHGGFSLKEFSPQAIALLQDYNWPGNVRELRNFIERLYILTPGEFVDIHDVQFAGLNIEEKGLESFGVNFREARARFEKDFLLRAIEDNQGNITKTAETIGLERSYLHRKIKSYGIDV